ncbi:hypothetical protein F5B20DRAFT_290696 [Whalleya microplaca]|nr:hypothetical protein F5B20DRAFT_290696 [Whalleya microplaca]
MCLELTSTSRHLRALERRARTSHINSPNENDQAPASAVVEEHGEHQDQFNAETGDSNARFHNEGRLPKEAEANDRHTFAWMVSQEVRQTTGIEPSRQSSYTFSSRNESQFDPSTLSLPQHDYILHLAQVVDFHLHANCLFVDHTVSPRPLNDPSSWSSETAPETWHTKLFALIALGKMFLERGATSLGPPGIREFLKGAKALPSNIILCQDAILAIETLCLLAIYAETANMHMAAYLYIAQAMGIARSCHLDKEYELPNELISTRRKTAQTIWWTVCVLDHRYSGTIGANLNHNMKGKIEDLLFPDGNLNFDSTVALQINISVARILTQVTIVHSTYKTTDGASFALINGIMDQLKTLRSLGQKMSKRPQFCFDRSLQAISRPVATIHLLFCHCTIIAAKPVLMHLFKSWFNNDNHSTSLNTPSEPMFAIMRTCVNATNLGLNIISVLHEQHLLEMFLPFNVEVTFLAALSLTLSTVVLPDIIHSNLVNVAKEVLWDMSHIGNATATSLGDELKLIDKTIHDLSSRRGITQSFTSGTSRVAQDGESLNNSFLNLVEVPKTSEQVICEPELLQKDRTAALTSDAENQSRQFEDREPQAAIRNTPPSFPLLQTSASMLQSREPDGLDTNTTEDAYDFNMLDLEWLEYVQ